MHKKRLPIFILLLFLTATSVQAQPGYLSGDIVNRPIRPAAEGPPTPFHIVLKTTLAVRGNPSGARIIATLPLPPDTDSQKILHWDTDPYPTRELVSRYGYRFAEFDFGPLAKGATATMTYTADIELTRLRYEIDPNIVGSLSSVPESIRNDYTINGPFYHLTSPTIRQAALDAAGSETNPCLIAQKVWEFVRSRLHYRLDMRKLPADKTLLAGHGSCTEYSFLMIALLRSRSIPARFTAGSAARLSSDSRPSVDAAFHKIVEAYLPNYGWVPMESTGRVGVKGAGENQRFFITTCGRLLHFVFEPEPGAGIVVDPRRNAVSFRTEGSGAVGYTATVRAEWTSPRAVTYDPNVVLPQALEMERIETADRDSPPD